MEGLNYHQRLKKLGMYSMERRRDRFRIVYAWQQLEKIKENVMDLKINGKSSNRLINNGSYTKKGITLSSRMLNKIHKSPLKETERTFNSILRKL